MRAVLTAAVAGLALSEPHVHSASSLRLKSTVVALYYPGKRGDSRDKRDYLQGWPAGRVVFRRTFDDKYKAFVSDDLS